MAKDLQDQQNDILKQFTAGEDDDTNILENEDNDIEFDENEDNHQQGNGPDDDDDDDDNQQRQQNNADDDDDDQQQQQQRQRTPGRVPATGPVAERGKPFYYKSDKLGNLVDDQNRVIFPKGRSRNVFEKVKKAYFEEQAKVTGVSKAFNEIVTTSKELVKRYKELKESANFGQSLGLTEGEFKEALQMRALMKSDAKGAIRKILTMAHLNGTDLTELGVNQPLDPRSVAEHMLAIQEAKKPKEPTPEDRARLEATSFLQQFPDAAPHIDLVAEAKRRFPQMTLGQIWYQIRLHAAQGGQQTRQQQRQKQPRNGSRPIPRNGQPSRPRVRDGKLSIAPVDPSQTFEQIGADLLRDLQEIEGR